MEAGVYRFRETQHFENNMTNIDRRYKLHHFIREVLRKCDDGMTTKELADEMPRATNAEIVRQSLKNMVDAYIDRWIKQPNSPYEAVWCVVVPPAHCPKPGGGR